MPSTKTEAASNGNGNGNGTGGNGGVEPKQRRQAMEPAERRRVLDALGLREPRPWAGSFWLLTTLSATVAAMGLSSDSAAVVIGAMLLAPLMTPVMAMAASITMAMPRRLWWSFVTVVVASTWSVAISYLLGLLLPDGSLSGEILARTRPDLRDLVVALAAGAAGAYATAKEDVSTALPGVAVAVALVPPLAAIGLTLEAGQPTLAKGACLLFLANFAAILLVSAIVFGVTGLVPPYLTQHKRGRVLLGGLGALAATLLIAVPLTKASIDAAEHGRERDEVRAVVETWLAGSGDEIDDLQVDDSRIVVHVSGPNAPPSTTDLDRAVGLVWDAAPPAEVRWTQTVRSTASDGAVQDAAQLDEAEAAAREAEVRDEVERWLGAIDATYDIDVLTLAPDQLRIDLTSAVPPPSVDLLAQQLEEDLGITVPVLVNWTERTSLRGEVDDAEVEAVRQRVEEIVVRWVADQPDVALSKVTYDGEQVEVELVGSGAQGIAALKLALATEVPPSTPIVVWMNLRVRLDGG